ncbi:CRISPR-associated protein Csx11 [Desulfofundulus thermobenzoicus]|uniref:CRISPR-associated protein Csx11 n=1 Tax=Desulfofundulus thermobenzoicus TaxID=29376 RepID=A0A6N7IQJ5_9FIRM|nr:CRISPR-associated protein Csx11 [Desulfofundulus thermobenzoicus]MQL52302.1 CRISPR-associated protein Csx11 [Desulfofundulus thermobenzoicus]
MYNLEDLKKRRETLLLAEVAAWLHDIGKFTDLHVEHETGGPRKWYNKYAYKAIVDDPASVVKLSKKASSVGKPRSLNRILNAKSPKSADFLPAEIKSFLENRKIEIKGESFTLAELIMLGTPGFAGYQHRSELVESKKGLLPALLGVCHNEAHYDKQEPAKGEGNQNFPIVLLSTPFGYETRTFIPGDTRNSLDAKLKNLNNLFLLIGLPGFDLHTMVKKIEDELKAGLGDTRRPINEVSLAGWSSTVAALFKSALSLVVLADIQPEIRQHKDLKTIDHDICWRILHITVNGIDFCGKALHLPDLLARRQFLKSALDNVRQLLETDYPLGNEIYRDEYGSAFVVPDLPDKENDGEAFKSLLASIIITEFAKLGLDSEITPVLWVSRATRKAEVLAEYLDRLSKNPPSIEPNSQIVRQFWTGVHEEACTVCYNRPIGPSEKAKKRLVCDICEQRRADRAQEWATERLFTTIWMDEVADINGRVALLTGQFDLTHWLDGTLVRTLAVRNPANVNDPEKKADAVAKNPSFARLRRIWETTRKFWQEILPAGEEQNPRNSITGETVGQAGPRLAIQGTLKPKKGAVKPGPYHAYSLVLSSGVRLGVVWDEQNERFLTAASLACVARLLGESPPGRRNHEDELSYQQRLHEWGAQKIKNALKETLAIEEPAGYGADKFWGEITDLHVKEVQDSTYTPVIPILAEPRTFLALVPAGRALAVVKAIKEKYEREMGKVRNRLPLNLGLVYADRRTPLRAILDAGRRMVEGLKDAGKAVEGWQVDSVADFKGEFSPDFLRPAGRPDPHFARWRELKLVKKEHTAIWRVPLRMGDGQTKDAWYPYVFIEQAAKKPANQRRRSFSAPNPWKNNGPGQLVHAEELEEGDLVFFTPATLDWVWLDSAGRRFEVAYDKDGVCLDPALQRRPYFLDELELLEEIWENLSSHLTTTQIYALRDLIERKRAEWQADKSELQDEGPFRQFCLDAVTSARWQKGRDGWRKNKYPWDIAGKDKPEWLVTMAGQAARGLLADCIELYLQITKSETRSPLKIQEVEG